MNKDRNLHSFFKMRFWLLLLAYIFLTLLAPGLVDAKDKGKDRYRDKDRDRPSLFLPDERRIIREFFVTTHGRGLPPGLAKRGGNLPPGLQKHLQRNGTLPPGLQKRLEPFPVDLEHRLPRIPEICRRVILGRHVILMDRRTNRILDIIENVIGLATDR